MSWPLRIATLKKGDGAPAGYTRTAYDGVPVTYDGRPVFDNGVNLFARAA